MERRKVIILFILGIIGSLIAIGILVYAMLFKKERGIPIPAFSQEASDYTDKQSPSLIKEVEKMPALITGVLEKIEGDKAVIEQFASSDIRYEISKEAIGSFVMVKENPAYDENKTREIRNEIKKLIPEAGKTEETSVEEQNAQTPPTVKISAEVKERIKALQNDPALKKYLEVGISWGDLTAGSQVIVSEDEKGQKKLTLYSGGINVGPTGAGANGN